MSAAREVLDFKTAAGRDIEAGKITSIIDPRLADHVRREASSSSTNSSDRSKGCAEGPDDRSSADAWCGGVCVAYRAGGAAYVPQISHVVQERCVAGISQRAFAACLARPARGSSARWRHTTAPCSAAS